MEDNQPCRISVLTLVVYFTFCLTVSAQIVSNAHLLQACETLLKAPLSPSELQTLQQASHDKETAPDLRSRAMAAYALTFLFQGDTNTFERATEILRTTYPDAVSFVKVTRQDAFVTCSDCAGSGLQTVLCPSCMGTGACKACAGTGAIGGVLCKVCKGKRACIRCGGKKHIEIACPVCKGTAQIFKPSEKIRENYFAVLSDLSAHCKDSILFSEQFQQASKQKDLMQRIALFENLIRTFQHRADLADAKTFWSRLSNNGTLWPNKADNARKKTELHAKSRSSVISA